MIEWIDVRKKRPDCSYFWALVYGRYEVYDEQGGKLRDSSIFLVNNTNPNDPRSLDYTQTYEYVVGNTDKGENFQNIIAWAPLNALKIPYFEEEV